MNAIILILAMGAVTYIPRALPAVFIDRMSFNRKVEKFLSLIPYTALAALIFPGVLSADAEHWQIGVLGGLTAVLLALINKMPLAVPVLASVGVVMLTYTFM